MCYCIIQAMNHINQQKALHMLAQRIREAREEANLSQATLAEKVGVSDKAISSYEKGRSIPPFENLKRIAESTNRPLTYFTDESAVESLIATKLTTIEKELAAIKKLLTDRKK